MGCFGDMTAVKNEKTNIVGKQVTGPDQWIQDAGAGNYAAARGVLDAGFVPFGGEFVAPVSGNEKLASELVASKAGGNPYNAEAAGAFRDYGAAPGFNYDFNTVVDPKSPLGSVQSYMDPFLEAVLGPMLRQLGVSGGQQRMGINANATQAGAYGDARHGVVESEQRNNQVLNENDIVGKAFSQAFGSAMQNRQTDASRLFQTQQAQEGADKAALERSRTSGIDLTNLDKYDVSRDLGVAGGLSSTGATERGVAQAGDDAALNEFMRKQGFTSTQATLLMQLLKGMPQAQTTTQIGQFDKTISQPDNTGIQALGAVGTAVLPKLAAAMFLDNQFLPTKAFMNNDWGW